MRLGHLRLEAARFLWRRRKVGRISPWKDSQEVDAPGENPRVQAGQPESQILRTNFVRKSCKKEIHNFLWGGGKKKEGYCGRQKHGMESCV